MANEPDERTCGPYALIHLKIIPPKHMVLVRAHSWVMLESQALDRGLAASSRPASGLQQPKINAACIFRFSSSFVQKMSGIC